MLRKQAQQTYWFTKLDCSGTLTLSCVGGHTLSPGKAYAPPLFVSSPFLLNHTGLVVAASGLRKAGVSSRWNLKDVQLSFGAGQL